jgi:hypothetical protein
LLADPDALHIFDKSVDYKGVRMEGVVNRRTLLSFAFGTLVGGAFVAWRYDPALFRWKPNVDKPLPPPPPDEGTLVVDPLSQKWDFNYEKVHWAPAMPLAQISSSVYSSGDKLETTLSHWGLTQIEELSDGSIFACVASNEKMVVVAFRGTDDAVDWLTNFDLLFLRLGTGVVHRGFYRSTTAMVSRAVEAAKAQGAANKLIWITGHSLGGAMALLFAYDCLQTKALDITGLVTFGQPMVVDGRLARYLNAELSGRYLRFVNGGDSVPRMVPGYSHCGNLVYFIDNSFKFDKPAIRAGAAPTKADEFAEALVYEQGPEPMSKEEFDRIKSTKSRRIERRKDRRRQIEPNAQAAAVEDHDMSRYMHWIGLFAGQAKVKPVASEKP